MNKANQQPAPPQPADQPPRRRIPVGDVGVALSLVTCLMIVVGVLAVRRLVGDSRAPVLEVPSGPTAPANPAATATTPPDATDEPPPQVLRPLEVGAVDPLPPARLHEASRPVYAERETERAEREAGWHAPAPLTPPLRNAGREEPPRYR